jgi:hypothetical protein
LKSLIKPTSLWKVASSLARFIKMVSAPNISGTSVKSALPPAATMRSAISPNSGQKPLGGVQVTAKLGTAEGMGEVIDPVDTAAAKFGIRLGGEHFGHGIRVSVHRLAPRFPSAGPAPPAFHR